MLQGIICVLIVGLLLPLGIFVADATWLKIVLWFVIAGGVIWLWLAAGWRGF